MKERVSMVTPQMLSCFKAYDVRGRLGIDLDESIAYRIGRATAEVLNARQIVVGRDVRASSESLMTAVIDGVRDAGADVLDIGLCGTEEMYFATAHLGADGGIEVTASHNPMDYNGLKMVKAGAAPLDQQNGLAAIRASAEAGIFKQPGKRGKRRDAGSVRTAYVECVLSMIDIAALRPLKILVNAGNGAAGPSFDAIAAEMARRGAPILFVRMHHEPDGTFPHGIPNPLLPENQPMTAEAVKQAGADFGVAWDGDFDRCFLFDHRGAFVPGEYVVGLLAQAFLEKHPGDAIVHDPRVVWNTQDVIANGGGRAVLSRTGHAFVKQTMRDHDAVYGGEMSAHHYFRQFMYCDSGMIPWLLIAELLGRTGQSLAALLQDRMARFPSSGEINFVVEDAKAVVARVLAVFEPKAIHRDDSDGVSLSFGDWRFNLRSSNTEPLLRLNVEARGDADRVREGVEQIAALIRNGG